MNSFLVSYKQLDEQDALGVHACAKHLLACAAALAPGTPIPLGLLQSSKKTLGYADDLLVEDALHRLASLGLLEQAGGMPRLHRLLADVVRRIDAANVEASQVAVEHGMLDLLDTLDESYVDEANAQLMPHLRFLADNAFDRANDRTARLCNKVGLRLYHLAAYRDAHHYLQRTFDIREHLEGLDSQNTATALGNLAGLLNTQGDYECAKPLYERALAISEQVLGPMHPTTALNLNNLALLLADQGDYERATRLHERSLAISEQVLGPTHPDTAYSLINLAGLLHTQGDYERAKPLYERALAISEQVLGPMHPATVTSLNNLAVAELDVGNNEAAVQLLSRNIEGVPNNSLGHYWLALALLGLGHHDTALEYLARATMLDNGELSSLAYEHVWRGVSLTQRGLSPHDAWQAARVAVEEMNDHAQQTRAHMVLAALEGQIEAARAGYQRFLATTVNPYSRATQRLYLRLLARLLPERADVRELRDWYVAQIGQAG